MAKMSESIYRQISTNFWSDTKVQEEMTAEDRYVFLYLLTNEKTQLCGCYEISYKKVSFETGYEVQQCKKIFGRLAEMGVIKYDETTSEVLIVNWATNNWIAGGYKAGVKKRYKWIKSPEFREYVKQKFFEIFNEDIEDIDNK